MQNGKPLAISEHVKVIKGGSLQVRLAETYIKIGTALLENKPERAKELERERALILKEMNPVINNEVPYPAMLSEDAYYGIAGEAVKVIGPQTEASQVALLLSFLACFGNVVGRGPYYFVGPSKHYLKLFIALVGNTGKSRKGMSWDIIRFIFERVAPDWVKERIQNGLSSGEGLIARVQDDIYKDVPNKDTGYRETKLVDYGVEDKRLLILEPELAQTLKVSNREANILSPILRNAWDNVRLQTMTKHDPLKATDTHISVIGHITQSELRQSLKEVDKANGFANRFIFACVDRSQVLPFGGRFDLIDIDGISARLEEAIIFAKDVEEITWAEETRGIWAEMYSALSEGRGGMIGAILGRAEAHVVRLGSLYALLDFSTEIKPAHLLAAIAIWEYCEASVRYIFQDHVEDPFVEKVYHAILDNPQGVSRTEISILLGKHSASSEIEGALEILESNNLAKPTRVQTGGRAKEIWTAIKQ